MNTEEPNYLETNRETWNTKTAIHLQSDFYDVPAFLAGKSSLNAIELELLGDVSGKSILHLQCHFGQDSISLARMGASVTGIDLSDVAIKEAQKLALACNVKANFVCSDVYNLPNVFTERFDMVFTSYGTIGWLPDLDRWAKVISTFLKPGGQLVFVEFHPVVWMFNDDFTEVTYHYFNVAPILETEEGTYADRTAQVNLKSVTWNHPMSEVVNALLNNGLQMQSLTEYDYSPYPCFKHVVATEPGKFRIKHLGNKIPMVYAITALKN